MREKWGNRRAWKWRKRRREVQCVRRRCPTASPVGGGRKREVTGERMAQRPFRHKSYLHIRGFRSVERTQLTLQTTHCQWEPPSRGLCSSDRHLRWYTRKQLSHISTSPGRWHSKQYQSWLSASQSWKTGSRVIGVPPSDRPAGPWSPLRLWGPPTHTGCFNWTISGLQFHFCVSISKLLFVVVVASI